MLGCILNVLHVSTKFQNISGFPILPSTMSSQSDSLEKIVYFWSQILFQDLKTHARSIKSIVSRSITRIIGSSYCSVFTSVSSKFLFELCVPSNCSLRIDLFYTKFYTHSYLSEKCIIFCVSSFRSLLLLFITSQKTVNNDIATQNHSDAGRSGPSRHRSNLNWNEHNLYKKKHTYVHRIIIKYF